MIETAKMLFGTCTSALQNVCHVKTALCNWRNWRNNKGGIGAEMPNSWTWRPDVWNAKYLHLVYWTLTRWLDAKSAPRLLSGDWRLSVQSLSCVGSVRNLGSYDKINDWAIWRVLWKANKRFRKIALGWLPDAETSLLDKEGLWTATKSRCTGKAKLRCS